MAKSLFISEDYVKSNSILDENVDVKMIVPTIAEMQVIHLERYLGSSLFNDLDTKIFNSSTNPDEDTLIENFIQPMLLKYVLMEMTTVLLFRYSNKNVSKKNSDNAQPIGDSDYTKLINLHKDRAEYYGQRLIEYLCGNASKFPSYCAGTDTWQVSPINNSFTSPFYLGNSEGKKYNPNSGKWQ